MTTADHYTQTRQAFRDTAVTRAGFYDASLGQPLRHSRWQHMVRRLVEASVHDVRADARSVLSVGCGRADFEIELASKLRVSHLVGCDFADEALYLAARGAPAGAGLDFVAADLLSLPFEDGAFAVTLCVNVLHHVPTADLARALDELARVTGRHLIVEIKNADQVYYGRLKKLEALDVSVYPTSAAVLSELLALRGLRLRAQRHVFGLKALSPLSVLAFERT